MLDERYGFFGFFGCWEFLLVKGHNRQFNDWSQEYTKVNGGQTVEALAEIYINARPKLKALYIASLVAQRMEQ